MSTCVRLCPSSPSVKPMSAHAGYCPPSQPFIWKRSPDIEFCDILLKLQITKPSNFSSPFPSLPPLTRRGFSSIGPKMDSVTNFGFQMFSQQPIMDSNCGPGNREMRRDLKWIKLKHDARLAKITYHKFKDRVFIYSMVLVITHGVIVALGATKVSGMWIMFGRNAKIEMGLLKLILNKLPISLEFILTTMCSAYAAALVNYSSAQYELKEAEEKLKFAELVFNNYEESCMRAEECI